MQSSSTTTPTEAELAVLDAVIAAVTRSRRMRREDAEDFRQTVYLRLAERDADVFRRFNGRSSLKTYLTVVVNRMFLDCQNHALGKWRPSAAATRLGTVAVTLDRLIYRDGFTIEEAIEYVRSRERDIEPADLRRMAASLPERRRRQTILAEISEQAHVVEFDDPVERNQLATRASRHRTALARALASLSRADRRLIWLRYHRRLTVRAVADRVGVDPKALYRHFQRVLMLLRRRLQRQGVTATAMLELPRA